MCRFFLLCIQIQIFNAFETQTGFTPSFTPIQGKWSILQSTQGVLASFFDITQNPKVWNTVKSCIFNSLPSVVYALYFFKCISPYAYYLICIALNAYDFAVIWTPIIIASYNANKIFRRTRIFALTDSTIIGISSLSAAAEVPKWIKRYPLFAGLNQFQTPITILFLSYALAKPLAVTY